MKENKREYKWLKTVRSYMQQLNIGSLHELEKLGEEKIKKMIREWGEEKWRSNMEKKLTLSIYRRNKKSISEEMIYDNSYKSKLMFRCRTNCLQLNWRK